MQHYIVGLDIGSDAVKAAVGEVRKGGKVSLLHLVKAPSQGIRKGAVDDLTEAAQALHPVLAEIKQVSKLALKNIYLGAGGADTRIQTSTGVVAVSRSDNEIYQDDMNRAIQGSQAVSLPPNRTVIHSLVREFIVDGVRNISDPVGMVGNRLEVQSLIIDGFAPAVRNLTRSVEMLGGSVSGLMLTPLAAARAVLTKQQMDLGVALIDVGFGKTGMCVYEENRLLHSAIFPVGSGNVTNDLAIGLKTGVDVAETIKLSFGMALAKEVGVRESVELQKLGAHLKGVVQRKFIADIIEVRLAEILEFVHNELKLINKAGRLPGGVVVVGGGAKMPGMAELVKQELRLAAQIGVPNLASLHSGSGGMTEQGEDPVFACAVGLLLWGGGELGGHARAPFSVRNGFRNFLRYFIP